jgi:serine/threonine protein kinase
MAHGSASHQSFFVMELLGPTIQTVRRACPGGRFGKAKATRVALQMFSAIEACHKHNVLHRDIKPSNFAFRVPFNEHVVILDFGLSRPFFDPATGEHFPERKTRGYIGTCRYQSFHGPQGILMTRRDDLISWFYSVVELAEGLLPWPGSVDRKETYKMKMAIPPIHLAQNLPSQFVAIWQELCRIQFAEEPNYDWIRGQMVDALKGMEDEPLDWLLLSHREIHALWSHEKSTDSVDPSTCAVA